MKDFLASHNGYPYNEIVSTRNSIVCKWVILHSEQGQTAGIFPWQTVYHTVLTKSLPADTVQELIVSGHALPLTPDMNDIMDKMTVWGQENSKHWHNDVVDFLAFTINEGIPMTRQQLVKEVIGLKVHVLIHTWFGVNSGEANMLVAEWEAYFDSEWQTGSQELCELTVRCDQYTKYRIAQVRYHAVQHPLPSVNVSSTTVVRSS